MGVGKLTEYLIICLGRVVRAVKYCFHSGAFIWNAFLTWVFFFPSKYRMKEKGYNSCE